VGKVDSGKKVGKAEVVKKDAKKAGKVTRQAAE
jgi:hypothetical protein